MDVEGLRTFLAVRRAGGFAKASKLLHRSQPAVSRRIAALEEELGAPLFDRAAGGARLSAAGRMLAPHAEKAVAALEDCRTAIAELQGGRSGPIELAAVGTLAGTNLTGLLRRYVETRPSVALTLRTATSREVSELVRTGEASLGLRYHPDPSGELVCEHMGDERLVVACRPDHPLCGGAPRLVDLSGETWLAFPNAPSREASSQNIFAQFLAHGITDVRWTAIDSLTAQKRLVEAGLGVALLPESAIEEERRAGTICVLPVDDLSASNPVCLVVRRNGYLPPAARDLIDLFRERSMFEAGPGLKRPAPRRTTPRRAS